MDRNNNRNNNRTPGWRTAPRAARPESRVAVCCASDIFQIFQRIIRFEIVEKQSHTESTELNKGLKLGLTPGFKPQIPQKAPTQAPTTSPGSQVGFGIHKNSSCTFTSYLLQRRVIFTTFNRKIHSQNLNPQQPPESISHPTLYGFWSTLINSPLALTGGQEGPLGELPGRHVALDVDAC